MGFRVGPEALVGLLARGSAPSYSGLRWPSFWEGETAAEPPRPPDGEGAEGHLRADAPYWGTLSSPDPVEARTTLKNTRHD